MENLCNKVRFYIIILIISVSFVGFMSRAQENKIGELIILLDVSGSIEKSWDDVVQWATEIAAYTEETGVHLKVMAFGGEEEIQSVYSIDSEEENNGSELNDFIKALDDLGTPGALYTDQKGAMQTAIKQMNVISANKKCIVMLSDGILDYEEDGDEEEARECFRNITESFAKEDGQHVFLIGFGNTTKMFQNIDNVDYYSGDMFKSEKKDQILLEMFRKFDMSVEKRKEAINNKQVEFKLDHDYYRTIINIITDKDMATKIEEKSFIVTRDGYQLTPNLVSHSGNLYYLYFDNSVAGEYTIKVLEEKWDCYVINIQKKDICDIQLEILEDREKKSELVDGIYKLEGISCLLKIEVFSQTGALVDALNNVEFTYEIRKANEDITIRSGEIREMSEGGVFYHELELSEPNTQYRCFVKIKQGKFIYMSNEVVLQTYDKKDLNFVPDSVSISINDEIPIREYFNISNDSIKYQIDVVDKDNNPVPHDSYEYNQGIIKFKKTGEYEIRLENNEDILERMIFKVIDDRGFLKKILDWFTERFS